jgi:hypothetical protein
MTGQEGCGLHASASLRLKQLQLQSAAAAGHYQTALSGIDPMTR